MEKRLGRGLAQIIETTTTQTTQSVTMLRVDQIRPSRYQPREHIRPEELEELQHSITRLGVIQPLIVRPVAHGIYELVAGERRWRAAKAAGKPEVPVIIKALTDQETVEHSIVENLQREDLNPIEEARAFGRLIEEFGHTQEHVAESVGKDRSSVANALRLLKLPAEIQDALREGAVSEGHAKVLLGIEQPAKQLELFHQTTAKKLSVRELEELAARWQPRARRRRRELDPQLKALEQELRQVLGTKVSLAARKRGGRIIVDYFSSEDLTRILRALGVAA